MNAFTAKRQSGFVFFQFKRAAAYPAHDEQLAN
jgi:hypothetical protein